VFENTYFTFFSDLKKHDFLRFFKLRIKKS